MFYDEEETYTSGNFQADQHRDWHTLARSEGTNEWACPWDCMDPPGANGEDDGPALYATVWYRVPGDESGELTGYSVFSPEQMRAFATTAAARTGKAVKVELARN